MKYPSMLPSVFLFVAAAGAAGRARADEPLVLRESWAGAVDFLATGAPMATDTNNDGKVDKLLPLGKVNVGVLDIPAGASLEAAYLYWGATQTTASCQGDAHLDKQVTFTPPGGTASAVAADVCYCSASPGYDMQLCRSEVTPLLGALTGAYTMGDLDAMIANGDTNNASFAVVLVYGGALLPQRRIGLYDGLFGLVQGGTQTTKLVFDDINVTTPPQGDLTWYALEGDAPPNQNEFVEVKALPGGGVGKLGDAANPPNNPFNRTINTTNPVQTGIVGVDVDKFSLTGILAANDKTLEITYSAGIDKYWIAFNVVGVDVFEPLFSANSSKAWALTDDVAGDGEPSPGDVVTYTIHLENTGTAAGTVSLTDIIPAEAASWQLIDAGGGTDMSVGDTLSVTNLMLMPLQTTDVVLEIVVGDLADLATIDNTATLDGDGGPAELVAPTITVRRDGDGDSVFDSDDNCPDDPNPGQADEDSNGVGDACDVAVGTTGDSTGGEATSTPGETSGGGPSTGGEVTGEPTGGGETGGATTGGTGTGGSASGTGGAVTTGGDTPTGGGATNADDDGGGASSGGSTTGDPGGTEDGGCGCRSPNVGGGAWLVLLGLAARRRRRV